MLKHLAKKLVVRDMTVGGHKSHLMGTELDFDLYSPSNDPVLQVNIAGDLLRISDSLRADLEAFRIGIYFDYFFNTEAVSFKQYKELYGDGKTAASMHLGVRYRWSSPEYQGGPMPPDAGKFLMWGIGRKSFNNSDLWKRRIRSWDVGFLKGKVNDLANRTIVRDFRALDYNPPPLKPTESLSVAE